MTNYQYTSNDPINNIDVDGLEGEISTLANPKLLDEVVIQGVKQAPAITKNVLLPLINFSYKIPKLASDHTAVVKNSIGPDTKL